MTSSQIPIHAIHRKTQQKYKKGKDVQGSDHTASVLLGEGMDRGSS